MELTREISASIWGPQEQTLGPKNLLEGSKSTRCSQQPPSCPQVGSEDPVIDSWDTDWFLMKVYVNFPQGWLILVDNSIYLRFVGKMLFA